MVSTRLISYYINIYIKPDIRTVPLTKYKQPEVIYVKQHNQTVVIHFYGTIIKQKQYILRARL